MFTFFFNLHFLHASIYTNIYISKETRSFVDCLRNLATSRSFGLPPSLQFLSTSYANFDRLCIPPRYIPSTDCTIHKLVTGSIIIHSRNSRATVTQRIVLIRANAVCKMYSITMRLVYVCFFSNNLHRCKSHPLISK